MKLRFTPRAANDIIEIADYIRRENPGAAEKVRGAILGTLETVARFPLIGRVQSIEGVRKVVTRQYRYVIYYSVNSAAGEVVVLTIQHPSREHPHSDR